MVYGTPEVVRMHRISGFASRCLLMGGAAFDQYCSGVISRPSPRETRRTFAAGISRSFSYIRPTWEEIGMSLLTRIRTCPGSRAARAGFPPQSVEKQRREARPFKIGRAH